VAGATACTACEDNVPDGWIGCSNCPNGQTSTEGGECTKCAAGTYAASGDATCTACEAGKASAAGATTCAADCADGYKKVDLTCVACAAGEKASAGATACTACETGKVS